MMKRYFLMAFALCLFAGTAFAQTSKLKRANKAFVEYNYMEAIDLYNQILGKEDVFEAKKNLATSYRKVGNTAEAEYWYGQVVNSPEAESLDKLYYGQMLQTNGKCDLAKEWYVIYVNEVPDDLRGQYLVKACDYEEELRTKNNGIYDVENMPFNTELDDFSPNFYGDGIVFASEFQDGGTVINREFGWTGRAFLELFFVDRTTVDEELFTFEYGESEKFSNRLNSKFHDATVSFSKDQETIYFTRNNLVNGKTGRDDEGTIRLKVFYATNEGGGSTWSALESLPFNSDEYSVAHPALSPDETKLYFASDMPGGFGGMDLYVSEQEDGRWGPPLNLGPGINTEGHEVFPYFADSGRLYFASDGHIGLGGLDLYYMDVNDAGDFGDIINMGYPLNTIADDFGIVMNDAGTHGYFSSDREGGKGDDDIYSFKKSAAPIEIFVYDELTKEGIEGATVIDDCSGTTYTTDAAGYVRIEQKLNVCCNFNASKEPYTDNSEQGCTRNIAPGEKVLVEIPLAKPMEFDILGVVSDEITGKPIEGALVELFPDCEGSEVKTMVTGPDGAYAFDLEPDCCYTVRASKEPQYIASRSKEKCTRGLTKSTTIKQDLLLKPTQPVRPTQPPIVEVDPRNPPTTTPTQPERPTSLGAYLLHIYYDFDQSYIRTDAEPELNKLLTMMKDNPNYVVEIGSHTDSRGSFRYNDRLSQRRAESVVRWLKERGVPSNRVKPKGYGENVNVNNCANNVPCSEEEHQWNRRTEFKILGYFDESGNYNSLVQESQRPDRVNVDPCQGCPF